MKKHLVDNFLNDTHYFFSQYQNEDGNPVSRTKEQYPYSYDPYVVWDNRKNNKEELESVYSDRLLQWDYDKYNKCHKEVFGNEAQIFFDNNEKDIEKFLQLYFNRSKLELKLIMNGANISNGFPYWIFFFKSNEE